LLELKPIQVQDHLSIHAVLVLFCLLWGSLVVRFGDDVAKEFPMQESLLSGSRVDALLRASELDINE
jgi:hypothetical protein